MRRVDENNINQILSNFNPSEKGMELELRVGYFGKGGFNSKINDYIYNTLIEKYNTSSNYNNRQTVYQTLYYYGDLGKLVEDKTSDKFEMYKKKTLMRSDMRSLGMRLDLSQETDVSIPPKNVKPTSTIYRIRDSFTHKSGIFRIDLSKKEDLTKKEDDDSRVTYDFEIEFLQKPDPNLFDGFIRNLKDEMDEYLSIRYSFNKLFQKTDTPPLSKYRMYNSLSKGGLPMPKNIKIRDIVYLENYCVLQKPDGISYFMLITEKGIYLLNNKNIIKWSGQKIPELYNTLILGELIQYYNSPIKSFLAFDAVFSKGKDLRNYMFVERHDSLRFIKEKIVDSENIQFLILPYYNRSTLEESVQDTLSDQDNKDIIPYDTDGIIIKSLKSSLYSTDLFKWKPAQHITIDLKLKSSDNNTYTMYMVGKDENNKKGDVLFVGDEYIQIDGQVFIYDEEIDFLTNAINNTTLDNAIVEFSYDRKRVGRLRPIRIRADKVFPNSENTVLSTWEDMYMGLDKEIFVSLLKDTILSRTENSIIAIEKICKLINIQKNRSIGYYQMYLEINNWMSVQTQMSIEDYNRWNEYASELLIMTLKPIDINIFRRERWIMPGDDINTLTLSNYLGSKSIGEDFSFGVKKGNNLAEIDPIYANEYTLLLKNIEESIEREKNFKIPYSKLELERIKDVLLIESPLFYTNVSNIPYNLIFKDISKLDVSSTIHLGQLKLLMTEVDFMTKYGHLSNIVVYSGAAPGIHTSFLSYLFPKHTFHLYDPGFNDTTFYKYNPKGGPKVINSNIKAYKSYFTDKIATLFWNQYSGKILFINDVRVGSANRANDPYDVKEENVRKDNIAQKRWYDIMKPVATSLKFRFPFTSKETSSYIKGDFTLQCYTDPTSAETRLFISPYTEEEVKYNVKDYNDKLFYHNLVTRNWCSYHTLKDDSYHQVNGLDHCYDCNLMINIFKNYLTVIHKVKNIPDKALIDLIQQAVRNIGNASLRQGLHGVDIDRNMIEKRRQLGLYLPPQLLKI